MLEQFKYLKNDSYLSFKIIGISVMLLCQISCFSGRNNEVAALTSPTEIPLVNKNKETPQSTDNRLSQDQLNDVSKLIERYQSATKEEKETARQIFDASQEEFQKERFTVSGAGFVESATVYPTVEALTMVGESIALLNITD